MNSKAPMMAPRPMTLGLFMYAALVVWEGGLVLAGEPSVVLGGAWVVVALGLGPEALVDSPEEAVTVLRVDSLALVGPTSLLEAEVEVTDSVGTGAGMTGVELVAAGAETGELSEPGTVVVAVVAIVLSTTVVVSEATEEVVGDGYGTGIGRVEVAPGGVEGKLSDPDMEDGVADGGCDGGRGAVSVTVYVLWPGNVASADSRMLRALVLSGLMYVLRACDSTLSAFGLHSLAEQVLGNSVTVTVASKSVRFSKA